MDKLAFHAFQRELAPASLEVVVFPGVEKWAPYEDTIEQVEKFISRDATVVLFPRKLVGFVWSKDHGGRPYDKDLYQFRAYARQGGGSAFIFVDETETPESIMWVILHELAHLEFRSSPYLFSAFQSLTSPEYDKDDLTHEQDPEEQVANLMAKEWMRRLGYKQTEYPRPWWRGRVAKMVKTAGIGDADTRRPLRLKKPRLATPRLGTGKPPGNVPINPFSGNKMNLGG
jgi:hypothetical protein